MIDGTSLDKIWEFGDTFVQKAKKNNMQFIGDGFLKKAKENS